MNVLIVWNRKLNREFLVCKSSHWVLQHRLTHRPTYTNWFPLQWYVIRRCTQTEQQGAIRVVHNANWLKKITRTWYATTFDVIQPNIVFDQPTTDSKNNSPRTNLDHVQNEDLHPMVEARTVEHRQMTVVMLRPTGLNLTRVKNTQPSDNLQYFYDKNKQA